MRLLDLRARLDARALNVLLTAGIDGGLGVMVLLSDPLRFSAAAFAAETAGTASGFQAVLVLLAAGAASVASLPVAATSCCGFASGTAGVAGATGKGACMPGSPSGVPSAPTPAPANGGMASGVPRGSGTRGSFGFIAVSAWTAQPGTAAW